MRAGFILAAALIAATATGARAESWCGYAAHEKALIDCGYSSLTECESAIGKGGVCFIDPNYALNGKGAPPATATPALGFKANPGRGRCL